MNRRQFLKSFGMTATAVAVAPVAMLKAKEFAAGGVASGSVFMVGEQVGETILPHTTATRFQGALLQGSVYGCSIPMTYGKSIHLAAWAESIRRSNV